MKTKNHQKKLPFPVSLLFIISDRKIHMGNEPVEYADLSIGISFEDIELIAKREVFQGQRTMRPQRRDEGANN